VNLVHRRVPAKIHHLQMQGNLVRLLPYLSFIYENGILFPV
jgi:hypothetical protein